MRIFPRLARVLCIASVCCVPATGCSAGSTTGGGKGSAKANFEKLNTGMSEKEVTDVMGSPTANADFDPKQAQAMLKDLMKGVKLPAEVPGIELPAMAVGRIAVKNWEEGDTLFEVVFQDGKVANKDSKTKKAKVTKDNADNIKIDMTKAQVEAILGKGTVSAGAKIEGFGGETVIWESDEAVIQVGFLNDKVAVAASFKSKN